MEENKKKILKEQIITYLGNKRKLIPFIDEVVTDIIKNDKEMSNKKTNEIKFFDIFAGSGVVSRYSKLKGFKTYSNDLELYSSIIQKTIIGLNYSEINSIFKDIYYNLIVNNLVSEKNIKNKMDINYYNLTLCFLNNIKEPIIKENFYFSKHYSPKDTNNPDFENERLFYTRENALKIDGIQEVIQNKSLFSEEGKNIILTSLMYNMTCHINTSGIMKGFHNGWGGKGKHALKRILGNIVLKELPFIDEVKGVVFNDYAEKVFSNNDLGEFDIIYADPPYNQHQYSANYNHLTTLVNNDKYDPGEVIKGSRAGIRKDHNRSNFCKSRKSDLDSTLKIAEQTFKDFITNVKSKYIIMSYNNEGIVTIDKLLDLMSNNLKNKISIKYEVYDKFKGGRVTGKSTNKVYEYLIIIEQDKTQSIEELNNIKLSLIQNNTL